MFFTGTIEAFDWNASSNWRFFWIFNGFPVVNSGPTYFTFRWPRIVFQWRDLLFEPGILSNSSTLDRTCRTYQCNLGPNGFLSLTGAVLFCTAISSRNAQLRNLSFVSASHVGLKVSFKPMRLFPEVPFPRHSFFMLFRVLSRSSGASFVAFLAHIKRSSNCKTRSPLSFATPVTSSKLSNPRFNASGQGSGVFEWSRRAIARFRSRLQVHPLATAQADESKFQPENTFVLSATSLIQMPHVTKSLSCHSHLS